MESGKTRRLGKIFRDDGRTVIVPMDHGVSIGPVAGLSDARKTVNHVTKGGADAILVHAGLAKTIDAAKLGLIVHLSGATRLASDPNRKIQVCTVKEAVRLGADAVSTQINVGSEYEHDMLDNFSRIMDECSDYSMPLLAMMYPKGPKVHDEHSHQAVSHATRLGYELGADIVQTNYTGDVESFRDVVESVRIPIVITGGPKTDNSGECLRTVHESIKAGAAGVSIGRNIFQHEDPRGMTRAITEIVHNTAKSNPAPLAIGEKGPALLARSRLATFPKIRFAI